MIALQNGQSPQNGGSVNEHPCTLLLVRLVVGSDQTEILRAGYWPSYNVPFHEQVGKDDSCFRLQRQKPLGACSVAAAY